jgi:hypothetical protein
MAQARRTGRSQSERLVEQDIILQVEALEAAFQLFVASVCPTEGIDALIREVRTAGPGPESENVVSLNRARDPIRTELAGRIAELFEEAKSLRLASDGS